MKNPNYFDKTDVWENEILDLVVKLRIACNRNQIPMFCSVCIANDENGTKYKNDMVSAVSSGLKLTDDKIVKFVDILQGFQIVPRSENDEWEFEVADFVENDDENKQN